MAPKTDVWRLPVQWLREEIGFSQESSLTTAEVTQWLKKHIDELPKELLLRERTKVIAYIVNTHHRLKKIAREKEEKAQAMQAQAQVPPSGPSSMDFLSDDEPLAKRVKPSKKKASEKKTVETVETLERKTSGKNGTLERKTSEQEAHKSREKRQRIEAIDAWMTERVKKDTSPIPRAEIEAWLKENRGSLPEAFLNKEPFEQRQHCYDVFARKGGMRLTRKNRKSDVGVDSSEKGPATNTVRLDPGSGARPSDGPFGADASWQDPFGRDGGAKEPLSKKRKTPHALGRNRQGSNIATGRLDTGQQGYTEWTFKGTTSGRFKFTGDASTPPPKSADFNSLLIRAKEQLLTRVASVKGWTVKIVSKEGTYLARYRYKKKDFMPNLEKVEEFLMRHPNLRKGPAGREGPSIVRQPVQKESVQTVERRAERPAAVAAPEGAKERPRTGKKDVLGEYLHTWTLLTDLEMRLEEHLKRAEQSGGRLSFSDAVEGNSRTRTQWQLSEALPDEGDPSKDCPYGLECNGAHLLYKREAGLPAGPTGMWSRHRVGGARYWTSLALGWNSRMRAWRGLAATSLCRRFSDWRPTSHAWTSHALTQATGPPQELQGAQKVMDVRLHPKGAPLLVAGCNISPNELILYNLLTGQATSLQGHNSFIQAVEFTCTGDRIVSCGKDSIRVWDSANGREVHCFGRDAGAGGELTVTGHVDRIGCMAASPYLPNVVATSGSGKDRRLLLWDVEQGQLAADLNRDLRIGGEAISVDTMAFASSSALLCGEDAEEGATAMIALWDVEKGTRICSLPAHDKYIVSCQVSRSGDTFITGAGDGCAALWDVRDRSAKPTVRIKLADESCEVTSVSFSSCDTYFQASSTTNRTLVFDRRYMSLEGRPGHQSGQQNAPPGRHNAPPGRPPIAQTCAALRYRPLHCLSHGPPMPTRTEEQREQAGVLAGYVDDGDQGVNHAQWFHSGSNLVTASGNGSVTIWDVSLGVPCLRTFQKAHAGSCNAVAVSLDDRTICSGGDDQKLTLYQDSSNGLAAWRLTALAFV